ncbi:hypothetical protein MMC20_005607 [Loxospora ochrophaea]|nr:hypothetical protein [Loxospora ochrophaea]
MSTRLGSIESGSPTGNRRPSSDAQEPARDAGGQIICTHPKCAKQPPVFQRKCEWTKHMDKHNRPYVCQEPGCDKIQGFTYSGGLLRHQREVHKQHGGPKTRYMCPFQDCKRSSGQGFSRKENLNEHLRRVHRGAGIKRNEPGSGEKADDGANDGTVLGGRSSGAAEGKKRRRVEVDDDESDDGAEDGLMREVRRLRKEVRDKDEQISDLQERMRRLEESLMGQPAFV